jgi:hypothetical protein
MNRCPSCDFLVQVEWHECRRCGAPLPLALREGTASLETHRLPTRRSIAPAKRPSVVATAPQPSVTVTLPPTDTLLPHAGAAKDNLLPRCGARRRKRWHW